MTKKLYIGNLPFDVTNEQLRGLITKFGTTTECEVMGRYAFVHMSTEDEAKDVVDNLDNYDFMGFNLNVKYSTTSSGRGGGGGGRGGGRGGGGYSNSRTKLYVGNLPMDCSESELEGMFAQYGEVAECDVIRNYGFVHMKTDSEAVEALKHMNNAEFNGNNLIVKLSTSVVHKTPGVGSKGECFKCGAKGHLSRDCMQGGFGGRGRGRGRGGGGGYPPRGGGGGRSYNGYSASSRDPYYDYPPPPRRLPPPPADDPYYSSRRYADDPYYSRAALARDYAPPPRDYAYGLRARSRSPPSGYRRRLSPAADYDRYYERLPARDPYDYPPPRRPPASRLPPPSRRPPPASRLPAYEYEQEPPRPKTVGLTNFADDIAL